MRGAGLVGLAGSWGLAGDGKKQADREGGVRDEGIRDGLKTLGRCVGTPAGRPLKPGEAAVLDIYYLWSLERVGVLYNLRLLGGKDWYAWGSEQLLAYQRADGAWDTEGYRGATPITDTCLALLFLKRADLAGDLSRQIEQLDLTRAK
jgi:hypothetical protein